MLFRLLDFTLAETLSAYAVLLRQAIQKIISRKALASGSLREDSPPDTSAWRSCNQHGQTHTCTNRALMRAG